MKASSNVDIMKTHHISAHGRAINTKTEYANGALLNGQERIQRLIVFALELHVNNTKVRKMETINLSIPRPPGRKASRER